MPTDMSKGAPPRNFCFQNKKGNKLRNPKNMGTVEKPKVYAVLTMNHSSNHFTLKSLS